MVGFSRLRPVWPLRPSAAWCPSSQLEARLGNSGTSPHQAAGSGVGPLSGQGRAVGRCSCA